MKAAERRRRVALVLGAGGARGLAHIGAIAALAERGFEIGSVAGTSIGAVVGGIFAAGKLEAYRDWVTTLTRSDVLRLLDFAFRSPGFIKGDRLIDALSELIGEHRIEQLPIPFTAVATDLERQREVWLTRGSLFDAVRASIAIPMIFTPHRIDGRLLVDGGLLAPVPIAATRLARADLIVAVDVNARPDGKQRLQPVPEPERAIVDSAGPELDEAGYRARIAGWFEGLFERNAASPPQSGMLELMGEALDTMQGQIARLQLAMDPPDILIRVPNDAAFFYEFWRGGELIERGHEIASQVLDQAGYRLQG